LNYLFTSLLNLLHDRPEATTEENKTIRSLEESIQRMAAQLGGEKKRATIAQALQVELQQEMKVLRAHEQVHE
jgi:hypothetical protein